MIASFVASVESTGLLLASARYGSGSTAQGTGISLNALFGGVAGCTATIKSAKLKLYRDNAGLWAMTRVGSRRVVQISAAFMFFLLRLRYASADFSDAISVIFTSHATIAAAVAVFLDRTLPFSNDEAQKDNGSHWWDKFVGFGQSFPRELAFGTDVHAPGNELHSKPSDDLSKTAAKN
ncbi:hypothetical protein KY290_023602 [Solanum tuberosum]|uniref:Uncharacterized protein n=1 Tax=Solanum tuberosum TaxID=4113 RepID=A0ABQ7V7T3_SOLTU|nr:hypothetical protein KY284_021427 [Solanum tuberosum]KAH0760109.1 hypothetical protein KY290_023602 [Solanum tuberosum]